jgi:GrpB-like predicted nucleotidyltransferase (UPF0157 family)
MKKIVVEEYNPEWKNEYKKARLFYERLFEGLDIEIIHVGSTSVEGLWAKPVLDIDIIVKNIHERDVVINLLNGVGYTHIGNLGIEGRDAFKYSEDNPHLKWMEHNLYVCIEGNDNVKNHVLLKKHLLNNSDDVEKYSLLKRELANKYPNDIDSYIEGKTELITHFLKMEGMSSEVLNRIESINKKDYQ